MRLPFAQVCLLLGARRYQPVQLLQPVHLQRSGHQPARPGVRPKQRPCRHHRGRTSGAYERGPEEQVTVFNLFRVSLGGSCRERGIGVLEAEGCALTETLCSPGFLRLRSSWVFHFDRMYISSVPAKVISRNGICRCHILHYLEPSWFWIDGQFKWFERGIEHSHPLAGLSASLKAILQRTPPHGRQHHVKTLFAVHVFPLCVTV
jgi:hypothetical protein